MKNLLINFWHNEDAATMIEMGLLVGIISIALATTLGLAGDEIARLLNAIVTGLEETSGEVGNET